MGIMCINVITSRQFIYIKTPAEAMRMLRKSLGLIDERTREDKDLKSYICILKAINPKPYVHIYRDIREGLARCRNLTAFLCIFMLRCMPATAQI